MPRIAKPNRKLPNNKTEKNNNAIKKAKQKKQKRKAYRSQRPVHFPKISSSDKYGNNTSESERAPIRPPGSCDNRDGRSAPGPPPPTAALGPCMRTSLHPVLKSSIFCVPSVREIRQCPAQFVRPHPALGPPPWAGAHPAHPRRLPASVGSPFCALYV